jgi:hypothetical protein
LTSSKPASTEPWTLVNPEKFLAWVQEPTERLAEYFEAAKADFRTAEVAPTELENEAKDRIVAVRFVHERVGQNPDFGEVMDSNTRRDTVPYTNLALTWTFSPEERTYQIIIPFLAP